MADEPRPPVAIRIARPYSTEEQYLEREVETITRTSVVLLGAQSRPQGVILRFEITLQHGASLLRGEGRVVGYKENAFEDLPGLTLRFTRLDSKSKALVDKAAAIREARARAAFESSLGKSDFPPPSSPSQMPPLARMSAPPSISPASISSASFPPGSLPPASLAPEPPDEPTSVHETAPPEAPSSLASIPPSPDSAVNASDVDERLPDDKSARLARLRERARRLTPDRLASILGLAPKSSKQT